MSLFSVSKFKQQFPLLAQKINDKSLIYFDSAATTQKPNTVIAQYQRYYQSYNANVHRASHTLSTQATREFELAREKVQRLINAKSSCEIVWTKGTTESINLIAQSWGASNLQTGDEILLSQSEHHANIVPWQMIAQQTGATIKVMLLTVDGRIDIDCAKALISNKTRVISFGHISNVIGKLNPVHALIALAKAVNAITVIDGAQAIANEDVDVTALDCDFYVFSAHKMYGPTGVGILYGKKHLLEQMPPYQGGGEMISKVSFERTDYAELPFKFEAGTPNIAGIIALGAAVDFITDQAPALQDYKKELTAYCYQQLSAINALNFIVEQQPDAPVFSFYLTGYHNQDVASFLDSYGIAVRAGHHCAMPLMTYLALDGCVRVSLAAYNTTEEIDQLVAVLNKFLLAAQSTNEVVDNQSNKKFIAVTKTMVWPTLDAILQRFEKAKSWDGKHREIMLLGKEFHQSNPSLRQDNFLIAGCESKAWLSAAWTDTNKLSFTGDSDAKLIRGLLAIVLAAFNNKSAQEISAFDIEEYFAALGLMQHLSPSRGNGLRAIVERIYQLAAIEN